MTGSSTVERRWQLHRLDREIVQIQAAILLVADGRAIRVTLDGLRYAERAAPHVLPVAQDLAIDLRVERRATRATSLIVGRRRSVPSLTPGMEPIARGRSRSG